MCINFVMSFEVSILTNELLKYQG